jgi:hypothetical protein
MRPRNRSQGGERALKILRRHRKRGAVLRVSARDFCSSFRGLNEKQTGDEGERAYRLVVVSEAGRRKSNKNIALLIRQEKSDVPSHPFPQKRGKGWGTVLWLEKEKL